MNTWLLGLQDSNTPVCQMMIYFHDFTMIILFFITFLIFLIMVCLLYNKLTNRYLLNNHPIELIWTIIPMLILIFIALPSLKLLYFTEEFHSSTKVTIKTIGRQWYWSYEYSDFRKIQFDSFMIPTDQLKKNEFRLLDVDNRCVLPYNFPIRILTTSMDVIHAWTVPSLGIKMDATPGRLNQTTLFMNRPGLFFGQCSEICGINHSFMPIVIESTNFNHFKNWITYMMDN